MLSVEQAIGTLLREARLLVGSEETALIGALGRVLAADVVATTDVPPADNSAMDGYALRHADWAETAPFDSTRTLPLSQRIAAGSVPAPLTPGTAARIFTGAEIPPGADTVVMQEQCEGTPTHVRLLRLPERGANIRRRGEDIAGGQRVLSAGHRLRPQDLGLAASLGVARLAVYRRLRVAILSTGDELVEPGEQAGPGRIFNSNRFTLQGQLAAWGFDVIDLGVVRDRPEAVREAMQRAAREADVVVSTGGVSVGEEDHVKTVVQSLGSLDLWRIAIRPGKPFAYGRVQDKPFLGLPGNPVSVFVTLLIVARPFLFACQGIADTALRAVPLTAAFDRQGGAREDYLRVRAAPAGLEAFPNQGSGVLYSTAWGDGLVRQPAGQDIRAGDRVDFLPWAMFN
jgi:molybdopterin molybdotransferase